MKVNLSKSVFVLIALFLFISTSCSSDNDEMNGESKKVNCAISFAYVENFIGSGRYPDFAKSCSLWVFDESGKLVKSFSESGEKVASLDYTVNLSLPEGRYDFVAWFGIEEQSLVKLGANPPGSVEDLALSLQLDPVVGGVSETFSRDLPVIYNGHLTDVEIKRTASANVARNVRMNLIRDSKIIDIRLVGRNNDEIKNGDVNFKITNGNNLITWDNSLKATTSFCYRPINEREYEINTDASGEYTTLIASFSTFPLSIGTDHRLIVTRLSDNTEVINISLVEALLKEKPMQFPDGSDEEYIARKDFFTLIFALGEDEVNGK